MSIVAAIDERLGSVGEEIKALEQQLDGKKGEQDKLLALRDQAQPLDPDGGGVASPAPLKPQATRSATPRRPKVTSSTSTRQAKADAMWAKRVDDLVRLLERSPEGLSPAEVRSGLDLSKKQIRELRRKAGDRIRVEGATKSARWHNAATPSRASAPTRAAQVPAPEPKTREQRAAAAQGDLRMRIRDAILDGLKDGPVGLERLKESILGDHAAADDDDFTAARRRLASEHRIEVSANKLQLTGVRDNSKPLTELEHQVVDACGSGRTAREVAANCDLLHGNAFTAARVLTSLANRGVIARRSDGLAGSLAVFEQLQKASA
jgi:hypothetical protein